MCFSSCYSYLNKSPLKRVKVGSIFLMREMQKAYSCCAPIKWCFVSHLNSFLSLSFKCYLSLIIQSGESMASWKPPLTDPAPKKKEVVGVDVFLHWSPKKGSPDQLAELVRKCDGDGLTLSLITNRGMFVSLTHAHSHHYHMYATRTPHHMSAGGACAQLRPR